MYWDPNQYAGYVQPNNAQAVGGNYMGGAQWHAQNQTQPSYETLQQQSMLYSQQQQQQQQQMQQQWMQQQFSDSSQAFDIKTFDGQFTEWEKQYDVWKEQNKNHPDKAAFEQYNTQWQTWKNQLLERRKSLLISDKESEISSDKNSNIGSKDGKQTQSSNYDATFDSNVQMKDARNISSGVQDKKAEVPNNEKMMKSEGQKNPNNHQNMTANQATMLPNQQRMSMNQQNLMRPNNPRQQRMPMNRQRMPMNQPRMPMNQQIMPMNQNRAPMNQNRMPMNQSRMPMNQNRMPMNQNRMAMNRQRMSMDDEALDEEEMSMNDQRMPMNQNRMHANQNRMSMNQNRMPMNQNRMPMNQNRMSMNQNRMPMNSNRMPMGQQRMPNNSNRMPMGQQRMANNPNRMPMGQQRMANNPNRMPMGQQGMHMGQQRMPMNQQRMRTPQNRMPMNQRGMPTSLRNMSNDNNFGGHENYEDHDSWDNNFSEVPNDEFEEPDHISNETDCLPDNENQPGGGANNVKPLMSLSLPKSAVKKLTQDDDKSDTKLNNMADGDQDLENGAARHNLDGNSESLEKKEQEIIKKAAEQLKEIRQKKMVSQAKNMGGSSANDEFMAENFSPPLENDPFEPYPAPRDTRNNFRGSFRGRNRGVHSHTNHPREMEESFEERRPFEDPDYCDYEDWWYENGVWENPYFDEWMYVHFPNFRPDPYAPRPPIPPMQGFYDFKRNRIWKNRSRANDAECAKVLDTGIRHDFAQESLPARTPVISIDYGHKSNQESDQSNIEEKAPLPPTPSASIFANLKTFDYGHGSDDKSSKDLDRLATRSISRDRNKREERHSRNKYVENESRPREQIKSDPERPETVLINDLLCHPGREKRPKKILIILRGLPGSGKSFVAKLIKEKEIENGGTAPRMLCLDDYFIQETELFVKDKETGKKTVEKKMAYTYEQEMENTYRASLFKSLKKNMDAGFHSFIIVDAPNDKLRHYSEFCSYGESKNYKVYIAEMENTDPVACFVKNIHNRTLADIQKLKKHYQYMPQKYHQVDIRSLLQDASITEVEMEDNLSDENKPSISSSKKEDKSICDNLHEKTSKWDTMDASDARLDKLDGIKKNRSIHKMEDYLQLPDDYDLRESEPGSKRVRWRDLEERKNQERARAIGFVVGQTDWDKLTNPAHADEALTCTKYI